MTVNFEQEYELDLHIPYESVAKQVILAALDYEQCPYEAQVGLLLVDNGTIRDLNRKFRATDKATDVLSFPLLPYNTPADFEAFETAADCFDPETGELLLGDIVVSLDKVQEQADLYGHAPLREYAFLIAHSMLHLMGYDHMDPQEAKEMERRQEAILQILGITRGETGQ